MSKHSQYEDVELQSIYTHFLDFPVSNFPHLISGLVTQLVLASCTPFKPQNTGPAWRIWQSFLAELRGEGLPSWKLAMNENRIRKVCSEKE